jgi:protein-S-isoprenylcysteine O-methyltransferase Ste14
MTTSAITLLVLVWAFYFGMHSLLASLSFKKLIHEFFPGFIPYYRIIFNICAVLFLALPLGVVYLAQVDAPALWQWQGIMAGLANGLALVALILFIWSLRFYDSSEFLGFNQLHNNTKDVEDQEKFCLSPLHRYIRHPWYFLALILIWTRDMDLPTLITAIMITGYFILGSRLEENKLLIYHGEIYKKYRQKVSALFPLPWKFLTTTEAEELMKLR